MILLGVYYRIDHADSVPVGAVKSTVLECESDRTAYVESVPSGVGALETY